MTFADLAEEIRYCTLRLDGPGITGHEAAWLAYVQQCLKVYAAQVEQAAMKEEASCGDT